MLSVNLSVALVVVSVVVWWHPHTREALTEDARRFLAATWTVEFIWAIVMALSLAAGMSPDSTVRLQCSRHSRSSCSSAAWRLAGSRFIRVQNRTACHRWSAATETETNAAARVDGAKTVSATSIRCVYA